MSGGGTGSGRWERAGGLSRLVMVPMLLALSAVWISSAGHQPTQRVAWAPYDSDNWSGGSDPSSPAFLTDPQGCDPIDPAQCMLPYPDDWFTKPDPSSATGRRLAFDALAMPRNILGKPINPADYNRSDGFGAGSTILTVVPGMTKSADLAPSGLPTDLNMDVNGAPSSMGVVLLDATTGQTWPVWAEIDQYTSEAGVLPAGAAGSVQQDLMIHPARNLLDGHRYIVALRHLQTDSSGVAQPSAAFESYVHGFVAPTTPPCAALGTSPVPSTDPRAAHMDRIFCELKEAGWHVTANPADLYLAWDFTTASTQNVTGRLLAIRDDAFSQLGESKAQVDQGADPAGAVPAFQASYTDFQSADPKGANYSTDIAREITGTFTVPCYIAPSCAAPLDCKSIASAYPFDSCPFPGSFYYTDPADPDANPSQVPGQTYQAGFICVVGLSGFAGHQLLRPVEYGHGLFGSDSEVTASPQEEMANREGMLYCATDWFGWSNSDIPNAILALADLSNFPVLADRGQQGELDFLYLQRLMIDPKGFATSPAFRYPDGTSFIDLGDGVSYDGNSQGGIFGGAVCAVSIDVRRCGLGVNGMDYSTLLPRSVDYVATSTLTQFVAQQLMAFAANPSTYDPTNLTGVGYSNVFDLFYPDQSQRQLTLDIIQTLWDRADPNGYASHMTASAESGLLRDCTGKGVVPAASQSAACPAGIPDHHVLMQIAWGDHQVANVTAFDEARTIGAEAVGGPASVDTLGGGEALLSSRLCNNDSTGKATTNDPVDGSYCYAADSPLWGLTTISSYPYDGSAIVIFDGGPDGVTPYGTDPPPPSDVPSPDTASNIDPHEAPRRTCAAQDMKGAFFDLFAQRSSSGGQVTDPVQTFAAGTSKAGPPYFSGGWQGTCALP